MAVFTSTGKQWTIDKVRETVGAGVTQKFIGWGTGATAEAVGNTALTTPSAEARATGVITSPSAALHRVIGTLTSASTQTITEVGLFDASTAGVMMIRALFTGIPLLSGDQIQYTLDLTQT